jgi:hypothetical protein
MLAEGGVMRQSDRLIKRDVTVALLRPSPAGSRQHGSIYIDVFVFVSRFFLLDFPVWWLLVPWNTRYESHDLELADSFGALPPPKYSRLIAASLGPHATRTPAPYSFCCGPLWIFGVHKRKLANSPDPRYNRLARPWILLLDGAPSCVFCESDVVYFFSSPTLE